jgi:hypothetical protein
MMCLRGASDLFRLHDYVTAGNTGCRDWFFDPAGSFPQTDVHWNRSKDHPERLHRANRQYRSLYLNSLDGFDIDERTEAEE